MQILAALYQDSSLRVWDVATATPLYASGSLVSLIPHIRALALATPARIRFAQTGTPHQVPLIVGDIALPLRSKPAPQQACIRSFLCNIVFPSFLSLWCPMKCRPYWHWRFREEKSLTRSWRCLQCIIKDAFWAYSIQRSWRWGFSCFLLPATVTQADELCCNRAEVVHWRASDTCNVFQGH